MTIEDFVFKALPVPFVEKGRDYTGWDCYGLIYCAYRDIFGIQLPEYRDYDSTVEYKQLKKLIEAERPDWVRIPKYYSDGDLAVFTLGGNACHVGLIIDKNTMIHAENKCGTVVEKINGLIWEKRLDGIYRYTKTISQKRP